MIIACVYSGGMQNTSEEGVVKLIKKILKGLIHLPALLLTSALFSYEKLFLKLYPKLAGSLRQPMIDTLDNDLNEVIHNGPKQVTRFWIYTPNRICAFRHSTFSSKEPEMLEWIEEFGGGTFYDIGANIGIYSIYYAKNKPGNVYSFEPSVFNLRQLAKNLSVNNLSDAVTIVSNPLSATTGVANFTNGNTDEGGALSAFGVNYGHDGKPIQSVVNYGLIGFALDDLLKNKIIPDKPELIKIDVDGIEHLILSGATKTLAADSLRSIFIEVNEDFAEQSEQVKVLLEGAGFSLREQRQSELIESSQQFGQTYNQIWVR